MNKTFTITFGDQAENHVGMQKIGSSTILQEGFTKQDLEKTQQWFEKQNTVCNFIQLNSSLPNNISCDTSAYILVVKKGLDVLLHPNTSKDFFDEQDALPKDTKAMMYGRVVNKKARYNLCFAESSQTANYKEGKGTVVAFDKTPLLQQVRTKLMEIIGEKTKGMVAEGNYYYDIKTCGIGFHGDAERKIVIGIRVGAALPLHYQWFLEGKPIGERIKLNLENGDVYLMSEKATGNDWKLKKIPTLRHAAGASKHLQIKEKKVKKVEDSESTEEEKEEAVVKKAKK